MIDSEGCGAAWEQGDRGEGLAGSVLIEPVRRTVEARLMDTDLEALATALYVTVDDLLIARPEAGPPRPRVGLVARTSWPSCRPCWAAPASGTGSATPTATCGACSPTSPASPDGASACAPWPAPCPGSSPLWDDPPASGTTPCGRPVPLPSSAPGPDPPSNDPSRQGGPGTGTAPPAPATSGDCACTWSPHPTACRWPGP